MPTRQAMAVHDGDVGAGFLQQRVGEGQARRAAADDEVVGVDGVHGVIVAAEEPQGPSPAGSGRTPWLKNRMKHPSSVNLYVVRKT